MNSEFNKEFPEKKVLSSALSSIESKDDGGFAARYYGKGTDCTLQELLGRYIAQKEYNKYKGIFLLDKSSEISLITSTDNKILNSTLKSVCIIQPPKENMGFRAYIRTPNTLFDKPIEVFDGTIVTVLWEKEGFSDIKKEFIVSHKNEGKSLVGYEIEEKDIKRIVYRSWFKVVNDANGFPIKTAKIYLNGILLEKDALAISESVFSEGVNVRVTKEGYVDNIDDNVKLVDGLTFRLKELVHTKKYILPAKEGKGLEQDAEITIETKGVDKGLPLKGYSLVHRDLKYDSDLKLKIKYFLLGILSMLAIWGLYEGCKAVGSYMEDRKISFAWPPIQKIEKTLAHTPEDSIRVTAIAYLDDNPVWEKDRLEDYQLTGLYDDLNGFEFDKLKDEWASKLNGSKEFGKIINVIEERSLGSSDTLNGTFNPDSVQRITISSYIDKIYQEADELLPTQLNEPESSKKTDTITDDSNKDNPIVEPKTESSKQSRKNRGVPELQNRK